MQSIAPDRGGWLDRHVHEWVAAGLITVDQADAIERYELDGHGESRVPPVAEVAVYLGSILAFGGGAAIIAPSWSRLGFAGQMVLALLIAGVALATGHRVDRIDEPGAARIAGFVRMVGVGGVALAMGLTVDLVDPRHQAWYPLLIGLGMLPLSIWLWANRERPLQLVTVVVAASMAAGGAFELAGFGGWTVATTTLLASLALGTLAGGGAIRPRLVAFGAAAVGLMVGSSQLAVESEQVAAVVAVGAATLIVVVAMAERSLVLMAFGLIAFFGSIVALTQTLLDSTLERTVAVAIGLAVVSWVGTTAARRDR